MRSERHSYFDRNASYNNHPIDTVRLKKVNQMTNFMVGMTDGIANCYPSLISHWKSVTDFGLLLLEEHRGATRKVPIKLLTFPFYSLNVLS